MALLGTVLINTSAELTHEKPFHAIGFKATITDAAMTAAVDETALKTALKNLETDVTISISYIHKNGSRTNPIKAMSLLQLAEFNQMAEGSIRIQPTGAANEFTIEGVIPLSESGSIPFNNDETLEMRVDVANAKTDTISFYTIESPVMSTDWHWYEKINMRTGDTSKVFDLTDAEWLMFPIASFTASTTLDFTYTNGKSIRFDQNNLPLMGLSLNDVVYNKSGLTVTGFGIYALIDVSMCTELEINRTSTTAFEMITVKDMVSGDLQKAVENNNGLQLTRANVYTSAVRKQKL